jgi:biotin transporter BioY
METIALSKIEKKILHLGILGKVVFTLMFVLLTALSSKVKIFLPFSPVPITMQTFSVLLSGIVLKEFGAISQVLYLLLGLSGMDVFAKGGGLSYIASPTFGYIIGFIFASYIAGYFTRHFSDVKRMVLGLILADLAIYVPGLTYLYIVLYIGYKGITLPYILSIGFLPFVVGDVIKVIAAFGFAKWIKRV